VVGRIKEMIIVGGMNHYPQDIENTVIGTDNRLRPGCCAAFATQDDEVERLAVIVEIDRKMIGMGPGSEDLRQLMDKIARGIWEFHDILASFIVLVKPATLPRTTSGKIQRLRCRAAFEAGTLSTIDARANNREGTLKY